MSAKLTDLTNLDPVELTDKVYVVDTSDVTDDPTGSSKEANVSSLPFAGTSHTHVAADIDAEASTDGQVLTSDGAGNAAWETPAAGGGGVEEAPEDGTPYARQDAGWVPAGSGGGGGSSITTLVQVPVGAAIVDPGAGGFVFSGIPQDGKRLVIKGKVKSTATGAGNQGMEWWANADLTAANYHFQSNRASNGTSITSEGNSNFVASTPGSSAGAVDSYAPVEFVIENYTGTDKKQVRSVFGGYVGNDEAIVGIMLNTSSVTAPLTTVTFDGQSGADLLGELTCYVEKEVDITIA